MTFDDKLLLSKECRECAESRTTVWEMVRMGVFFVFLGLLLPLALALRLLDYVEEFVRRRLI